MEMEMQGDQFRVSDAGARSDGKAIASSSSSTAIPLSRDPTTEATATPKNGSALPRQTPAQRSAGCLALFQQAGWWDWALMLLATLLATMHGAILPAAMLVFGLLTNAFVNQYSSAQLANYEVTFDPFEYIAQGRFVAVDINVIKFGFINFTNITGGVVNCSDSYELLPFNQTFDDILKVGVTQLASCLDNKTFLVLVTRYTLMFVGLAVAAWVVGGAHVTIFRLVGQLQAKRLRASLFSSVVRQEMGWHDATPPGQVASRLTEDVAQVQDGLGERLGLLLQWLATLVAGVIVSVVTEWRLTLLMGFAGLLIAASTAVLSVATSLSTSYALSLHATASAIAEEALAAIATVKAFGAEEKEAKRYKRALRTAVRLGWYASGVTGLCLGIVQLLVFSCYASAFWLGAYLVQEEIIQAGQFVTVFFAVLLVGVSIGQALPQLQRLVAAETAARTLRGIVTRVPLIDSRPTEGVWPEGGLEPSVEFRNVSFCYPARPHLQVMKGVNLQIAPGQTVAVVGATGSGKSTVGHLLTRLYDVSEGQVLIGGYDVRSVFTDRLRGMVGVVSQDPALFQTSIAQNIQYGSVGVASEVPQEAVELAAQQAHAHQFITSLPDGYNTPVGERGTQLSGGQKQRIAIARALVRNPKILLLDEATSALDTESEKIVQDALDKAREGRTTIVIAHRLSTVRHADSIIVMEGGVVVETGSHDELLQRKGVYYSLVHAQLSAAEVEEAPGSHGNLSPTLPTSPGLRQRSDISQEQNESDPVERNGDNKNVSWFRVLRLSGAEWPLLVAGVMAASVQGAIFPSFSILFGQALVVLTFPFNQVFELIHKWAGLFLALGFISAVATMIKVASFSLAGERLTYRLRSQSLARILHRSMRWFDDSAHSPSALATVLASDTPLLQGVTGSLSSLTEVGVGLLAAVIIAMVSSWILAVLVLVFIPVLVAAGLVQVWLTGSRHRGNRQHSSPVALEPLAHMRTVQLFGLQETFLCRYCSTLHNPAALGVSLVVGGVYGFTNFIVLIAYAVTFLLAAFLLTLPVDHALYANFDEVFTVFLAVILGSVTAGQASAALPLVTQATSAASKVLGVMATQADDEKEDGKSLEDVRGAVALSGIHFSFPARPQAPVLTGLSVGVAPGHCLALVGPSGAGKSTVMSLLLRFYSAQAGLMQLDGADVTDLALRWWRGQVGWVPQDTRLFNRSIADNISYGCHGNVAQEDVEKAAKAANIHSFIISLPQGYLTMVGSSGDQLSGGQKQRIAIARALVRNPKILLLDEATSALDTESEKIVQDALDKAREGRTTIVIAHRLSTIAGADHIAILRAGRVVEEGAHLQLLKQHGVYWRLVRQQEALPHT